MAETDGSIAIGLRFALDELKQQTIKVQAEIDKLTTGFKAKGEEAGKVYVQGVGKSTAQLNAMLNNFVSTMSGISPKMGALGGKIASVFSKPIFSMLPKLALAFRAMFPIIALIAGAIALVAKAVGGAVKAQKEFSDNVKKAKEAQAALSGTVEKANTSISGQQKGAAALRLVFEKLADGIKTILQPALDGIKTALDFIGNGISWVADKLGIVSTAEQEAAVNAQKLVEQNNSLLESYKANETELANIDTALKANAITAEEADKRKLSSAEGYLQKLIELRTATAAQAGETSKEVAQYDKAIKAQVKLRDSLALTVKAYEKSVKAPKETPKTESADVTKRKQIMEQYYAALRGAESAYQTDRQSGMKQEEAAKKQLDAVVAATKTTHTELLALGKDFKYTAATAPIWAAELAKVEGEVKDIGTALAVLKAEDDRIDREKEIAEILKAQSETIEEQNLAEDLSTGEIKTQTEYENQLFNIQRERARAKLAEHLVEINATEDEVETVMKGFDAETQAMRDAKKAADDADGAIAKFFASEKWTQGMQLATAAVETFTGIMSAITEAQNNAIREQVEDIDEMLDAELERIEEMRQRALEEADFAEATTQESLQAKLDAAIETGDQVLAYEYQRRMEEKAINDKFDAQAKAAEEKAAKEKAQLEYKAAKAEWGMSISQGTTNAALAVLQALSSAAPPINFILAGLVGAASAVQTGIILANPPSPPSFHDGGLVPGTSFSGDRVLAQVNSGERILTMDNQEFMLAAAGAGGSQTVTVVVPVYLEGQKIAEVVADEINSARVMLEKRGIKGL